MTFARGAAVEANFDGFELATLDEIPAIDVAFVASDDDTPHGLGEPPVCPLLPAVTNALARLAGRRIRRLPIAAEDLS